MLITNEEKINILGDKRIVFLIEDSINLVLQGRYNFGSTLHNKILFLFFHQFITPSIGNRITELFCKHLSHIEYVDMKQDILLIILMLIDKYNPNKKRGRNKNPLSIIGYISVMLPYMIKKLINKYLLTYYYEQHLTKEYSYEYNFDYSESVSLLNMNFVDILNFLTNELKLSSTELSNMWLINPASIRRRRTKSFSYN
jgi:hypothetical protein